MRDTLKSLVSKIAQLLKQKISDEEVQLKRISEASIFDAEYYHRQNPDLAGHSSTSSQIDALLHYFFNGVNEGRSPCYLFDTEWYLKQNQDVAEAGINPLYHYIQYGEREGRKSIDIFRH